ncbi:MAG: SDR family oxidoreductase [Bryobacterales bacterium]|nr:SDR family oxidoreductase [Bryobacterales bacterium]
MSLLSGKVALVTGASRGIGLAIAQAFSQEGAACIITGRRQETLDAAARGFPARAIACHVGRAEQVAALADTVLREYGRVDILVNNAATNIAQGPSLSVTDEQFDKMMEINLKSALRLIRCFAPGMCERGSGAIVNIASEAGLRPLPEAMLYNVTKAGLIMMTQSLALEFGPRGVRVNAIAPGLIETRFSEYYWKDPARLEARLARQPVKHLGRPSEVAAIAVLLASDRASYLTGQVIAVDGGWTIA